MTERVATRENPNRNLAVVVSNLVKRYGSIAAVDDLSFTVQKAEVFALLGPNGAGKTTTVETLEGYRTPDSGRVSVLGFDPVKQGHAMKQRIGLMLQQNSIYDKIRVREAVAMFASYYPNPKPIDSLIETVGLHAHTRAYFSTLSGGQKQRLSLALALVGNPALVFLDEPTASMDPQARIQVWDLIRNLRIDGVTVVLTTHYMEEAQRLADRVCIIDRGKLVALGRPDELIGSAATDTVSFIAAPGLQVQTMNESIVSGEVHEDRPGAYSITTADPLAVSATIHAWRIDHGVTISDFRVTSATLEDVFLELTGKDVRD